MKTYVVTFRVESDRIQASTLRKIIVDGLTKYWIELGDIEIKEEASNATD